jgi:hypothetical protein
MSSSSPFESITDVTARFDEMNCVSVLDTAPAEADVRRR